MNKKEMILDALQALLHEGKAGTASVQDISNKAGIAKGGMYYYFKSKEEALDALAKRQYANVIEECKAALKKSEDIAIEKLKLLLYVYRNTTVDYSVDKMLHQTENAAIHQKSMANILEGLSPIVADIFRQGAAEGSFICDYPVQYADITVSTIVFLLDPGIFSWTDAEYIDKLKGLADLLEKGLCTAPGEFSFLYKSWSKQKLSDGRAQTPSG